MAHQQRAAHLEHLGLRPLRPGEHAAAAGRFARLAGQPGYAGKTDVITELAQTSFLRYTTDRIASQTDQEYASFASLPPDLRDSSIAYISSIHSKLETLGYEVLPAGQLLP